MTSPLLLTGANGQLGTAFNQHWAQSELDYKYALKGVGTKELNLVDESAVNGYLDALQPRLIVNAAAYTAVDKAESERDQAFAVNEAAAANLARWCARNDASMLQISTDFVFDGEASEPYAVDARPNPLSAYGESKLAGENQVQVLLNNHCSIVRTSWLYSEYGSNFVKTMLRLMAEKSELGVVADQIGSPTSVHSLVKFLYSLIASGSMGTNYHWTDGGEISWHEFAEAIQQEGMNAGLLESKIPLNKLTTAQYPTAATRPSYSVMDRSTALILLDEPARNWREELSSVVTALRDKTMKDQQ